MYSKVKITGEIEVITGMHIGGSSAFAAIGAVDSPVVRDSLSGMPMIPGSSMKGKMRTLLSRSRNYGRILKTPDEDGIEICRVFGSKEERSRVLFSDSILSNYNELKEQGVIASTEVKFENTINRASGIANPRQIERVVRGAKFPFELLYEMTNEEELKEDMELLADGLKLLELDYIGGSGSRGYGKIQFRELTLEVVMGTIEEELISQCCNLINNR